jgi:hypothetical protein
LQAERECRGHVKGLAVQTELSTTNWGCTPGIEASIPMIQIKFPPFSAKSVHPSVNLSALTSHPQ